MGGFGIFVRRTVKNTLQQKTERGFAHVTKSAMKNRLRDSLAAIVDTLSLLVYFAVATALIPELG